MAGQGLMTLDEAAAYLGVAKITLRRWTRKGELACVRILEQQREINRRNRWVFETRRGTQLVGGSIVTYCLNLLPVA